jgi:Tfp pilus assembly protein PilW
MNKKGFTLIEAVLYVGISSLVIFMISFFLIFLLQTNIKNQTVAEIDSQGLFVMRLINQTIRNSAGVNSPIPGENNSVLSLEMSDSLKNPTIFFEESGVLYIKEGTGENIALTNSLVFLSELSFENYSATSLKDSINFSFILSRINNSGRNEYDYSKKFYAASSTR